MSIRRSTDLRVFEASRCSSRSSSRAVAGSTIDPRAVLLLLLSLFPLFLSACATAQAKTTTLTVEDIHDTAAAMADKLRASDLLRERTPDSPRMVIAVQKVENLTMDLIPEPDRWYLVDRVLSSFSLTELSRDKNIAFVIPAEKLAAARSRGTLDADFAAKRNPTHEMTATFRSVTRAAGLNRTDLYLCEYRITDLASGALAWSDNFEFKRAALGRAYD